MWIYMLLYEFLKDKMSDTGSVLHDFRLIGWTWGISNDE